MEVIQLTHPSGNSTARLLPEFGFNLFSLKVLQQELLWSDSGLEVGEASASGSGIPVLFPFPGRLRGKNLLWNNSRYALDCDDGRGNAIHGFVLNRAWRIVAQGAAEVTGEFHAAMDAPELLTQWPADFRIQCQYVLQENGIVATFRVDNPGTTPLPCGIGTHAYLRVPLNESAATDCHVEIPVQSRWELENMLTTGQKTDLGIGEPFSKGVRFGDLELDDVFSDVIFENGMAVAAVTDAVSGQRLTFTWDEACPHCVVYIPPHREAICIEPYSLVPGGYAFDENPAQGGLKVLQPRDSFTHRITVAIQTLD